MSHNLNEWNGAAGTSSTEALGIDKNKNLRDSEDADQLKKDFYIRKTRQNTCLVAAVLITVLSAIACLILVIFLVREVKKNHRSNMEPTKAPGGSMSLDQHCYTSDCLQVAASLKRNMNSSVDPCENFYEHSCASWIRLNPIPPSKILYDTFIQADDENARKLREFMEEVDELPEQSAVKKTKRYFHSCVDEEAVEQATNTSLTPHISKYGSWPLDKKTWNASQWEWSKVLQTMIRDLTDTPLFSVEIDIDPQNSSQHMILIMPPSLSLIREKYLAPENKTRLAYLKFMTKVGKLLGGGNDTRDQMAAVMELETRLANITPPRSVLMRNYHRNMNISELERQAPGFKFTWLNYINDVLKPFNVWVNITDNILVPSPEYLKSLSSIVDETDKRILSNYMMWTLVRSSVPYLSRDFRQAKLEYQKEVEGKKSATPRWLYCVEEMNGYYHGLTYALGYMYVTNAFDTEIIPFIQEMMSTIRQTFRDETSRDDWIDEQTRQKIIEKEKAMKNKVGFPKLCANETLLNEYYKDVNVSRSNYFRNALDVMKWRTHSQFSRLKTPVDKEQWFVGPQLVNAFYLPNRNEINILAGILQPPFYYGRKAPRAVNFGAVGMVLGHELSHGFDAIGRYFNENGEITGDWWTADTSKKFEEKSKCFVDQYNKYSVDGENGPIHINGELSLSENIADNGGIRLAYWGYKDWVNKNGPELRLPGLNMTNEQLLFVSFAQMWCSAFTPSAAYELATTDTHTLANYRVIGSLSNMKEFSDVFKCPSDSRMNPEKKCKIW